MYTQRAVIECEWQTNTTQLKQNKNINFCDIALAVLVRDIAFYY